MAQEERCLLFIVEGNVSEELSALPIDLVSKSLSKVCYTVLHSVTQCYCMCGAWPLISMVCEVYGCNVAPCYTV